METAHELSAGEWAVLALLAEQPRHGWEAVRALAPDGEIGRIWSLSRPLVYRALQLLTARGLIEDDRVETSTRGPSRKIARASAAGQAEIERWLGEPVGHVRDTRTLLLMKLAFAERRGRDPRRLLEAQLELLVPIEAGLAARARTGRSDERMLASYRLETARAVRRFVSKRLAAR